MKKLKPPRTVTLAIATTITITIWVFFSIYQALTKTPEVDVNPKLLEPIDPSLNTDILNSLDDKVIYDLEGSIQEIQFPTPEEEINEEVEEDIVLDEDVNISTPSGELNE